MQLRRACGRVKLKDRMRPRLGACGVPLLKRFPQLLLEGKDSGTVSIGSGRRSTQLDSTRGPSAAVPAFVRPTNGSCYVLLA
jgi:hypothetical protein